jgi:hypothetical protein
LTKTAFYVVRDCFRHSEVYIGSHLIIRTGLLGIEGGEREGAEWVVREGVGAGGRNEPSLVCTYE